jgi:ribosomal protein L14
MVQKGSYLVSSDKNGILLLGVFHLYGGFYKKFSIFGSFLKVSVKQVSSFFLVLKKSKFKSLLILTKKFQYKNDNSFLKFKINSSVILKRRLTVLGRELLGPCNFNIFRKRFMFSFICII